MGIIMSVEKNQAISVVVPVYNEAEVIVEFHNRLSNVMNSLGHPWIVYYIDDGSTDMSSHLVTELQQQNNNIKLIRFSRNFGKEAATTAGLDLCGDNVVVLIDCDLQDPPEVIPELFAKYLEGYDVVYAKRTIRHGETWLKRFTAKMFYKLMSKLGPVELPQNVGDFRIMSKRAVMALRTMKERTRFMKGLFAWVGFPSAEVLYERHPRHAGTSKWNYARLTGLGIEGIVGYTTAPLRISTILGLLVAGTSLVYGLILVAKTIIWGNPVPGYPSIIVAILFLGGMQLLCMGIIGEYLARIFIESKGRPIYILDEN